MVHPMGGLQNMEEAKVLVDTHATPLPPRCGTIYGHDAIALVLHPQPCMTVRGVHNI